METIMDALPVIPAAVAVLRSRKTLSQAGLVQDLIRIADSFAREAGCHYGQGFLYFRPVSQERVFELIHQPFQNEVSYKPGFGSIVNCVQTPVVCTKLLKNAVAISDSLCII